MSAPARTAPFQGSTRRFALAIFAGAALLFLVQPMIGRMALPRLGGSPSVWNACMLFFQFVLLLGYLYAHAISGIGRRAVQVGVHAAVTVGALALLPVGIPPDWSPPPEGTPVLDLLGVLAVSAGAPFFVLSTTGPLLQRWFSRSGGRGSGDPYFLYAASNAGSLLGLLAYPLVVEPSLALRQQSWAWSAGFVLYALAVGTCAYAFLRAGRVRAGDDAAREPAETGPAPSGRQQWRWVLLAFIPSSLMLGTTQYVSTDVAAVPMLWVIPLALYLVTFILAYSGRNPLPPGPAGLGLALSAMATAWVRDLRPVSELWLLIAPHMGVLFFGAMMCHALLADERPGARYLTRYYLLISVGGALGGCFNSLVAPVIFDSLWEYPLIVVALCALRPVWPSRLWPARAAGPAPAPAPPGARRAVAPLPPVPAPPPGRTGRLSRLLDVLVPVLLCAFLYQFFVVTFNLAHPRSELSPGMVSLARVLNGWTATLVLAALLPLVVLVLVHRRPLRFALTIAAITMYHEIVTGLYSPSLYRTRTFFGVYSVEYELLRPDLHWLVHGTTQHGVQDMTDEGRSEPLSYYHRAGPVGHVMRVLERDPRGAEVAVIGLGVGTMAAYAGEGRRITFYEIDPAIVDIARDPSLFTFLTDAGDRTSVIVGDGRLQLARADDGAYGVIVLDAFTSDAIPVHLLTTEALALCFRKLRPDGILAVHVTNRHLRLAPVLAAAADRLALTGARWHDNAVDEAARETGRTRSQWVVLARSPEALAPLMDGSGGWRPLVGDRSVRAWTDDYSNILSVLHWTNVR